MNKSLLERAMAYKKFKNSYIKTSEKPKNIKKSDGCLEIIETKKYTYD